jgi:RNA polymerase sigma-70 factor (ECF subfamily)
LRDESHRLKSYLREPAQSGGKGDEHVGWELLARLMDEHAASLTLYARQWCAAPEDVVQEAFLKLARLNPPPRQPTSWLYKVVRNGALSAASAARRRRRHEAAAAARIPTWFAGPDTSGLDAEAATTALEALPSEQREIIVAHLWGGLTFEEIAELTGVSSSTTHRWYLAGLEALRQTLGVPCPTQFPIPT